MNCEEFCPILQGRENFPAKIRLKIEYAFSTFFCFNVQNIIIYRDYLGDSH